MSKVLIGIVVSLFLFSCGIKKEGNNPFAVITQAVDSVGNVSIRDDVSHLGRLEIDNSFDDFMLAFAFDSTFQYSRTVFPLSYIDHGVEIDMPKDLWYYDNLFVDKNYYTSLFNNERELDMVDDTVMMVAHVDCFFLKQKQMKRYLFERDKEGAWILKTVLLDDMKDNSLDEVFFSFYTRFATDSLYQLRHISFPLRYVTIDPDDEFSILETTLDMNQWCAFRPVMPSDWLTDICYGKESRGKSNVKILKVNGIGNGYSNLFYFRKVGKEWMLYKYEDAGI